MTLQERLKASLSNRTKVGNSKKPSVSKVVYEKGKDVKAE